MKIYDDIMGLVTVEKTEVWGMGIKEYDVFGWDALEKAKTISGSVYWSYSKEHVCDG